MPILATEAKRFSNVIKQELWASTGYCREVVTVNAPAATYAPGVVLGKVTATGKYKPTVIGAADGSEVAAVIVLVDQVIPANTDTKVLVMTKGPATVSKAGLILDASIDTAPELAAVYAAFEAKGINCVDAV